MVRKYCKLALPFAVAVMSFCAFADHSAAKAAKRFATGGDVTSFHYTDAAGVGYTAFVHTFTNTAAAAEFKNTSGKTFPVRLLAVGGGGAGMDGYRDANSDKKQAGGGGGGGGGVTETNALLSAGDVWTIRVGAGGVITDHSRSAARGEAGSSSVSSEILNVQLVNVPGGGAGGCRDLRPTVGAAGGGGSGGDTATATGFAGNYTNSVGGVLYGPYSGGSGGKALDTSWGGGGGGAGANGVNAAGGEGLACDITGVSVVYGSGGGGGGYSNANLGYEVAGGVGGTNAGIGGNCVLVPVGATTNISVTKASSPIANTGSGGAGGVSFIGGANYGTVGDDNRYATGGADGVVIIRYDIPDTPCVGGDVVTVMTNGLRVTYIHKFTNTTAAATFKPSIAFDGTSVRLLSVGGGGAGMDGIRFGSGSGTRYPGGGGGGGGGVTETNALLSVGEVWTIRVGAGGFIANHTHGSARGESSASSVSNGVVELVLTPGGGAGGGRGLRPTVGAAGGGGAGAASVDTPGTNGTYRSSTFYVEVPEGAPDNPDFPGFSGGSGSNNSSGTNASFGGGGGGAGAAGFGKKGGAGLESDITGEYVFYGSGGGGGGCLRADKGFRSDGGDGGDKNAAKGGTGMWKEEDTSQIDYITPATAPVANTGGGGAGGISFGASNESGYNNHDATYSYATDGADGVVIIRYEVDIPRRKGFVVVFH